MPPVHAVEIRAEVRQVKTMVDHTINVTLNLPEECLEQAKILMGWQGEEVRGVIQIIGEELDDDQGRQGTLYQGTRKRRGG